MNRDFVADDVGKMFICTHAKSDGDQYMLPGEKLIEGNRYTLMQVRHGQGIFEGVLCWGSPVSYAADRFEPVDTNTRRHIRA